MTEEKHRYILQSASDALTDMVDEVLELLEVGKPNDLEYAMFLAKTVSKLSPLVGNMLEYYMVGYLNEHSEDLDGTWVRQDPGFPDTCYKGDVTPEPGIEVKAWFPLATEITARFKDSVTHFEDENINIALIAWVPEYIIYGRPVILDVCVESAKAVAVSRDAHYHDPPAYLVLEPEDTSDRTSNLQQSNTNGYRVQDSKTSESFKEAQELVDSWVDGKIYDPAPEYQEKLRELMRVANYRLDTNYAKMNRIEHKPFKDFKTNVMDLKYRGRTIKKWKSVLSSPAKAANKLILQSLLDDYPD